MRRPLTSEPWTGSQRREREIRMQAPGSSQLRVCWREKRPVLSRIGDPVRACS